MHHRRVVAIVLLVVSAAGWAGPADAQPLELLDFKVARRARIAMVLGVVLSPDGEQVYYVDRRLALVGVLQRDGVSGELTYLEEHEITRPNAGGNDVAVSADGSHLYVVTGSHTLEVFARDGGTGRLTPIQVVERLMLPDLDFHTLEGVALSPDDRHVYVASRVNHRIVVFSRDTASGLLTFVESQVDSVDGVMGLEEPRQVAVSLDGAHVYASASLGDSVIVFARDTASGELAFVERVLNLIGGALGLDEPFGLDFSPDGKHLYVGANMSDSVAAFARDETSGELSFVDVESATCLRCEVMVTQDGLHVYTIDQAIFDRDPLTGALTPVAMPSGARGYDLAEGADGGHVYGAGAALRLYDRAPDGNLTLITEEVKPAGNAPLFEPRSGAFSPDGSNFYVLQGDNEDQTGADALLVLDIDASGQLQIVEEHVQDENGVDGLSTGSVEVSGDGANVYASRAVFERDGAGSLTFLEAQDCCSTRRKVSPDGKHVYFVYPDSIRGYSRGMQGALTLIEEISDGGFVDGLDGASDLAITQDGENVYVVGTDDDAVAVFSRDATTGTLTFLERQKDGVAGVTHLAGPQRVSVGTDDRFVYVTTDEGAVVLFERLQPSGLLGLVQELVDGVDGVTGLSAPSGILVSADGRWVLVQESDDNLTLLRRLPDTGTLRPHRLLTDVLNVDELVDTPSWNVVDVTQHPAAGRLHFVGDGFYVSLVGAFDWSHIFSDGFESGDTQAWQVSP